MSLTDAIILGVVQGLTEFLPISSSGHLVLFQKWLGVAQHSLAFDVAVHLGTVMSIFTVYFALMKRLLVATAQRPFWLGRNDEGRLFYLVMVGSIPTAIIGLGFKDEFEAMFASGSTLGYEFLITAALLLVAKLRTPTVIGAQGLDHLEGIRELRWWQAGLIGVAQGISIAPGISRSGATIATGLLLGLPGATMAMFSFILSVPAILGAALLELRHVDQSSVDILTMGVGAISAYIAGLLGLWSVIHVVRRGRLEWFVAYLTVLGVYIILAW